MKTNVFIMSNNEMIFLGYINGKILIYNTKEKKYLYGRKEKTIDMGKQVAIITILLYPLIKIINDKFVLNGNLTKLWIIVLSGVITLSIVGIWWNKYSRTMLARYKEQSSEEVYLEPSYLINH